MSSPQDQRLLEALLDSWDRNNTILVNLLRTLPDGELEAWSMEGSPRSRSCSSTSTTYGSCSSSGCPRTRQRPAQGRVGRQRDPDRIARMLNDSSREVRDAVRSR